MAKAQKVLRRVDPETGKRIPLSDRNLNLRAEVDEIINRLRRILTNTTMRLLIVDTSRLTAQERRKHKRLLKRVMHYLEVLSGPAIVRRLLKKFQKTASGDWLI